MTILFATPRDRRARGDVVAPSPRGGRRGIQIGPRIRIGGSVGKVGQQLKIGAGKVLSNPLVDTALAFVPGVGPGIAAGARGLGTALDTSHGSVGLGDIVKNTAEQYGINKVATSLPGLVKAGAGYFGGGGGSAAGDLSGGGGSDDPYDDNGNTEGYDNGGGSSSGGSPSAIDRLKSLVTGGGSDGKGNLGYLGDLAGGVGNAFGGGGGLLDKGLLAAAIADAANQRQKKENLQKQGLAYETDAYSAKQPLRQRGLELLQDETPTNLSSIFANPANPYNKNVPAPQVGTRVPMTPPKLPTGGTY